MPYLEKLEMVGLPDIQKWNLPIFRRNEKEFPCIL